ncbi:GNAT family N-acetyltransferase [Pontibacter mangrovi]|uniref:GNAT family N-acetyltransferase n=1 Tax=Pontibacter mangrovi TaxID=2589816 RepID=A0A501W438_9BACT|nr:GNAT family N-acetyltransferase [Pontibacter mangrovi]TPE43542.1 GNAT family N-acetyltransferase [Pontibacter mangrovi]
MSSSTYRIRPASEADIPTLIQLAEATWEPTYRSILTKEQIDYMFEVIYSHDALAKQMLEGQTFLLVEDARQALGFASFSEKDASAKLYKLNKIYLLPQLQGQGMGRQLLQAVEQEVQKRGARALDLNVNRYNKAKTFYERCGYQVHEQVDIAIGPYWMNDYVMRKQLK